MKSNIIQVYRKKSYGLFIHMGLYSQLGGIYQGKETPFYGEWIRLTMNIPKEEYHSLTQFFRPNQFNAKEICQLAKAWGMNYICFTAKHHDGFAMFHSAVDEFNSEIHMGRDFVAELAQACAQEDIMLGLYYSQAQDWDHPGGLRAYQEKPSKEFYREYFENKALPQIKELLTNYGPIGLLWLDTPTGMSKEDCQIIADVIRELQPECLIGGRIGHGLGDIIITGDNRLPRLTLDKAWELPATLNSSWGYRKGDDNWRTPEKVIHQLRTVISRGGNLLLNIGPDELGQIPEGSISTLNQVGQYLKEKGEAFYTNQSTPDYPYEQSDFVLTSTPGKLFIHLLRDFSCERLELYHLENQIKSAHLMGSEEAIDYYVGQDLEGHTYWCFQLPQAQAGDIIEVQMLEESVSISPL